MGTWFPASLLTSYVARRTIVGSGYAVVTGVLAAAGFLAAAASALASWWRRGEFFVRLYTRSRTTRIWLEVATFPSVILASMLDLCVPPIRDPVASGAIIVFAFFCLSSGLSGTARDNLIRILVTVPAGIAKVALILELHPYPFLAVLIYLILIAVHVILLADHLNLRDLRRRANFLKTILMQRQLDGVIEERQKSEELLLLTLPKSVVERVRGVDLTNFDLISEEVPEATVMFVDVLNFEDISKELDSRKNSLAFLNQLFRKIDKIALQFPTVERIKTIHSKIMFLGTPSATSDKHLVEMVRMARAIKRVLSRQLSFDIPLPKNGINPSWGFGIHVGSVVTGILGKRSFCFEVYGDTVNFASRLLSIALPGQIVVAASTWEKLNTVYPGVCIGERHLKGKGSVKVYNVDGEQPSSEVTPPAELAPAKDATRATLQKAVKKLKPVLSMLYAMKPLALTGSNAATAANDGEAVKIQIHPTQNSVETPLSDDDAAAIKMQNKLSLPERTELPRRLSEIRKSCASVGPNSSALSLPPFSLADGNPHVDTNDVNAIFSSEQIDLRAGAADSAIERCFQLMEANATDDLTPGGSELAQRSSRARAARVATTRRGTKPVVNSGLEESISMLSTFPSATDAYSPAWLSEYMNFKVQFKKAELEEAFLKREAENMIPHTRNMCFKVTCIQAGFLLLAVCGIYIDANSRLGTTVIDLTASFNARTDVIQKRIITMGISVAAFVIQLVNVLVVLLFKPSSTVWHRISAWVMVLTSCVIAETLLLAWTGLSGYWIITTVTIPGFMTMLIMSMRSLTFITRTAASLTFVITSCAVSLWTDPASWPQIIMLICAVLSWGTLAAAEESCLRFDFVVDAALSRQAALVKEELDKSNTLLQTILPARVIMNLLEDATMLVYEEFDLLTVLHMDIAGFTSISSSVEPMDIFLLLNTLFAYFDTLTAEFDVEKITTIGDAYVASSNPAQASQSPQVGAASVCIVASLMQKFVRGPHDPLALCVQQVPPRPRHAHRRPLGPVLWRHHGRNDKLSLRADGRDGDHRRKVQELAHPGQVHVSETTMGLVKSFRRFAFRRTGRVVRGGLATYEVVADDDGE
ncbi:nucleotide cyclase [Zopfochytrium polystomum]|nr:nucleotide cyclase [Zopfochytrium polystomum]